MGGVPTQVFGYSFIVLRCSTVILLFTGLLALYRILRDFGVGEGESGLLTLTVLSSPAVLFLSFTFQTDVQFLGWQVLALWLYSRALRRENYGYMALASLAAFAAVGTRQFGAALVAGLATTYLIFEQERLRKASLYFVGLALPLLMTLWQFSSGINRPTFSQKVRLAEQLAYLHHVSHLLGDFLWRPTVILQYVGLFLFPLLPVLVILARNHRDGLEPDNSGAQPSRSRSAYWFAWWLDPLSHRRGLLRVFFYLPRILMPVPRMASAQQSNFSVWFQKACGDYCSDVWSCHGPGLAFIEEICLQAKLAECFCGGVVRCLFGPGLVGLAVTLYPVLRCVT